MQTGKRQSYSGRGNLNYRPQTKFAKVMFSQVFACPRGGGGGSLSRGKSLSGGVSVHRGLCQGEGSLSGRSPLQ